MINNIALENFRVFKKNTGIDLAPLTILTGTNSSGKSSFVKATQLLNYNLKLKNGIIDGIKELSFRDTHTLLGGFSKVVTRTNNKAKKSFDISLNYFSSKLQKDVNIVLTFEKNKKSDFDTASLKLISFYNQKKKILSLKLDLDFYSGLSDMEKDVHESIGKFPWKVELNYDELYSIVQTNINYGYKQYLYRVIGDKKKKSITDLTKEEQKVLKELP